MKETIVGFMVGESIFEEYFKRKPVRESELDLFVAYCNVQIGRYQNKILEEVHQVMVCDAKDDDTISEISHSS